MGKLRQKALVVLSGGQDSVTCLAKALQTYGEVEAITFTYGQRHEVELLCSRGVCQHFGVKQKVVDLSFIAEVTVSALTSDGDLSGQHPNNSGLPASFVPNRNAMFMTVAHAWAQTIDAQVVVTGVCQTDYSGYPDCREEFMLHLADNLNVGSSTEITFEMPLMWLTKAETFALAEQLGVLESVLEMSHTCYEGDRTVRHAWGYGCGTCPACVLRAKGWEDYQASIQFVDKGL